MKRARAENIGDDPMQGQMNMNSCGRFHSSAYAKGGGVGSRDEISQG